MRYLLLIVLVVIAGCAPAITPSTGNEEHTHADAAVSASASADTRERKPRFGPRLAISCEFSHRAADDPLVMPGEPGHSHMHNFYGNTGTDAHSTPASLRAGMEGSKCLQPKDGSAWWVPDVRVGANVLAPARRMQIYAERPKSVERDMRPYPADFTFIATDPVWRCKRGDWSKRPPTDCVGRNALEVRLEFPHGTSGVLNPHTQITLKYTVDEPGAVRVLVNDGWTTPAAMHADFMNGFDTDRLRYLTNLCLNRTKDGERRPDACRVAGDQ